ncbi:MAG: hypothetical protein HFJ44_03910 [Clostridia bacterium]|jgi:hypothetical protein|nr:hypothetical protein [Clostridia bacterium]
MLYDDYIKESLNETINIYGPDTVGRMEDFKTFFEDATLLSAIKGHQLAFTSAGNIPTSNISQALIGSGINKSGQLPIGRCYLTNILDDENLQKIIDEKLNQKMVGLINKVQGKGNEYGINRYIAENPKSDPNAFEMVDVLSTYNNLIAFGKTPPENVKSDLDTMFSHRRQNFIENGIGLDSAAYRICEFCHNPNNFASYPIPAVTIAAMRKIASLDLYSRQQIRDGGKLFDNVREVETVKNYFNASNNIKPVFLDTFKVDLENLYDMAKENRQKNNQQSRS